MHRPSLDLSLFLLPPGVRTWLLAVWCLGIWAMDNESHHLSLEAWGVQRCVWREEEIRHSTPYRCRGEGDHLTPWERMLAAPEPHHCGDLTEEEEIEAMRPPGPPRPPRVALYRVGPRAEDVLYAFPEYPSWRWGP